MTVLVKVDQCLVRSFPCRVCACPQTIRTLCREYFSISILKASSKVSVKNRLFSLVCSIVSEDLK